jgi:hypothetical protein
VRLGNMLTTGVVATGFLLLVGAKAMAQVTPPSVTITTTGYVAGNPETSEHAGTAIVPGNTTDEWRVLMDYGKWVPGPGGANVWTVDAGVAVAPLTIPAGGMSWGCAPGGGVNLGGGVTAGRITHMRVILQNKPPNGQWASAFPVFKEIP